MSTPHIYVQANSQHARCKIDAPIIMCAHMHGTTQSEFRALARTNVGKPLAVIQLIVRV